MNYYVNQLKAICFCFDFVKKFLFSLHKFLGSLQIIAFPHSHICVHIDTASCQMALIKPNVKCSHVKTEYKDSCHSDLL